MSHVLQQAQHSAQLLGDTCLFVALFLPHMWHPLPRQIKAFILGFVKSTNQCLFSPFVLICEWDIIPNFADMRLCETRRSHLCRNNGELRKRSRLCAAQKSPDARLASEPQKWELWVLDFSCWAAPHMFWRVNASFIRSGKMNIWIWYESATALSWTHVLFKLSGIYIVGSSFWFSLMSRTDIDRWWCWW